MKPRQLTEADLDAAERRRRLPTHIGIGGHELNAELLLAGGAVSGPHRRTHPQTVTWRMRALRLVRQFFLRMRAPL